MNLSDKNHSIKSGSEEQEHTLGIHPDIDDLGILLSNKDSINKSDNHSLILHVAECLECQKRLTVLTSLNQSHQTIENTTVSEAQQMLIVDYVHRGFSISRKKLLRQKIQDEPSSLKAMLYYASHSEAMRLNLKQEMTAQESGHTDDSKMEKAQKKYNFLSIISHLLMKVKSPFKFSLSFNFSIIYSIFISLVSIGLLFFSLSDTFKPAKIEVVKNSEKLENKNSVELELISSALNDSNFIYAQELAKDTVLEGNQSQIKQALVKHTLGKVTISLIKKETLHIAWPVSGKANRYTLSFYASSNRTKNPDLSLASTGNFVELNVKNFEPKKRYRWVYSYQTLDEKIFQAKGEFVIKPFIHKNESVH